MPSAVVVTNRTSGISPLNVLFCATASTSSVANTPTKAFHEMLYRWNAGDTGASGTGTWLYGADTTIAKNVAEGPIFGHLYEVTEGGGDKTFLATCIISDGVSTATATSTITVYDPDGANGYPGTKTICVSSGTDFALAKTGSTHATQSDFVTALNTYNADNTRVLFKNGDSFATANTHTLPRNLTGATISSWGTGAKPIVTYSGGGALLQPPNNGIVVNTDIRICYLNAKMGGAGNSRFFNSDNSGTSTLTKFTFYRNDISNMNIGIEGAPTIYNEIGVYECTFSGMIGVNGYGSISEWVDGAWMGNQFTGMAASSTSHNCRFGRAIRGVFSFNSSDDGNGVQSGHLLKLHAPSGGVVFSEAIVIASNKFIGGHTGTVWYVNISPQNSSQDQRIRLVLVERNWFVDGANGAKLLRFHASLCTARNNLFFASVANQPICFEYEGAGPACSDNWAYNNTAYKSTTGTNFAMVNVDATATNTTIKNNLGYAPNATSPVFMTNGGVNTVASNNSSNADVKNTNPGWVNGSGSLNIPTDFKLLSTSSYHNTGDPTVPIYEDFFSIVR